MTTGTNTANIYRLRHSTIYEYEKPVVLSHSLACVIPRDLVYQKRVGGDIIVEPRGAFTNEHVDYFGNRVVYISAARKHKRFALTAESLMEIQEREPAPDGLPWEQAAAALDEPDAFALREYRLSSPMIAVPAPETPIAAFTRESFAPGRPLVLACRDLMGRIFREFKYDSRATVIGTPPARVMEQRKGVCQDFAHLFIAGARSLGLAARYVSGYIETRPPPGRPKLRGADASHAWAAVWVPGYGWCDFDPTNDQIPSDQHITLAWGRDFADVSPLKGVIFGGGKHTVKVAVDMQPLDSSATT